MKTSLWIVLFALVNMCGCFYPQATEKPGRDEFQILEGTKTTAILLRTGETVEIMLPRGCVISVVGEREESTDFYAMGERK